MMTLTDRCQKNPGNYLILILTLVWASENTASSAYVGPYMFRKTFVCLKLLVVIISLGLSYLNVHFL